MNEKKLFLEIPGNHKFHSCVLTTFCFDFHYFESKIMKVLKSKGISNISVFADSRMLDDSIGFSTGNIKTINSAYAINGVFSEGAFHPKLTFCAGENNLLVLFGSGNLTVGGMGKNHELFSGLFANELNSPQLPIIIEIWNYILQLTKKIKGVSCDKLDWVKENPLMSLKVDTKHLFYKIEEGVEMALLYNEESPIYDQLTSLIPLDDINEITVYCPYYDQDGQFLKNLAQDFHKSHISVFLPEKFGNPPNKVESIENINYFSWSEVKRAQNTCKNYERKLHAKIYYFRSASHHYLLIGSPNATIPGFGSPGKGAINDEFAALYKFSAPIDMQSLGLSCQNYKVILPNNLIRQSEETEIEKSQTKSRSIRIIGADRTNRKIIVYTEGASSEKHFSINVFNHWGNSLEEIVILNNSISEISIECSKIVNTSEITYLQVFDLHSNPISNKQMINNTDLLYRTNPSPENLKLLELENNIETDNWDDLDIVEFFYTIKNYENEKKESFRSTESSDGAEAIRQKSKNLSSISYSQALELMKLNEYTEHLSRHHHSVRIWDSIYTYFNELSEKKENDDLDDEEEGNITSGRDKIEITSSVKNKYYPSEVLFQKQKKKHVQFLQNYAKAIDKAFLLPDRPLNIVDLSNFLIVIKNIIRLTDREIEYGVINSAGLKGEKIRVKGIFMDSFGDMHELSNFTGAVLVLLGKFSSYAVKSGILAYPTDEYQKSKFKKYIELVKVYSLFCLTALKQKNTADCNTLNSKLWLEAIACDIFLGFGVEKVNYKEYFDELIQHSNIKNITLENCIELTNYFEKQYSSYPKNLYFHCNYGSCFIEEQIPKHEPKFFKVSKPGIFGSEEINLMKNDVIEISSGKIFRSKQQYQKQK